MQTSARALVGKPHPRRRQAEQHRLGRTFTRTIGESKTIPGVLAVISRPHRSTSSPKIMIRENCSFDGGGIVVADYCRNRRWTLDETPSCQCRQKT
jgi:hypothetical protein